MSRGPGKWQRAILAFFDEWGAVPMEVFRKRMTPQSRSDQASFSRALSSLFKAGRLDGLFVVGEGFWNKYGRPGCSWWWYSVNVNCVSSDTRLALTEAVT